MLMWTHWMEFCRAAVAWAGPLGGAPMGGVVRKAGLATGDNRITQKHSLVQKWS